MWSKIVAVHLSLKQLIISGEEFDKELETYIQPVLEQRSALDHISRAKAAELGLKEDVDDIQAYVKQQLDKALGHLYRGFFDAADWFSISIRDGIKETLEPYSHECIQAAIPSYFNAIYPKLIEAEKGIASIRNNKDIIRPSQILEEVEQYGEILNELLDIHEQVSTRIPAMIDYQQREAKKSKSGIVTGIIIGLLVALFAWGLSLLGGGPPGSSAN